MRTHWLAVVGALALFLAGCGGVFPEGTEQEEIKGPSAGAAETIGKQEAAVKKPKEGCKGKPEVFPEWYRLLGLVRRRGRVLANAKLRRSARLVQGLVVQLVFRSSQRMLLEVPGRMQHLDAQVVGVLWEYDRLHNGLLYLGVLIPAVDMAAVAGAMLRKVAEQQLQLASPPVKLRKRA